MAELSWELIRIVEAKLEAEKNAEREREDDDRPMCPAIQELINDAKAAVYAEAKINRAYEIRGQHAGHGNPHRNNRRGSRRARIRGGKMDQRNFLKSRKIGQFYPGF